ncbi:ATP-binding protein [Streptomyces sp. ACA25]|uniref:uridine kinase family protein n=1 Tax=Streptomyces sp. ACA25 TaxID=3022596 RepID=UPI0023078474|nr:ATP-binding protein [Streptomyces sp. ACA25]MDB1087043.1 ATP-binding protein [Streptomyces sp. ACA25]
MTDASPAARVILLTGPSGSGKSSLAARTGLPVLHLDDFYKEAGDPTLPPLPDGSGVDWDAPESWDAEAALAVVRTLCTEGRAVTPLYDISASARTGERKLDLDGGRLFVAEGIFAAEIAGRCTASGLMADTLCLRGRPLTTFRRRLIRDVREARKPLPVLLRRGWTLLRTERALVERHVALGAHPCGGAEALRRIDGLPA